MVDLSSDKVTMPLRQWPRGRINNGSDNRLLFLHSHAQSLGHWRSTMVTLSGTSRPIRLRTASTVRLSAPEHHRYVRVLDWKVSRGLGKRGCGWERIACKCKQGKRFIIIFKLCERLRPIMRMIVIGRQLSFFSGVSLSSGGGPGALW